MDSEKETFIKLDRSMLKKLGYKNTWKTSKFKRHTNGSPVMIDNRNDFTSFTRFLKKRPDQFREGTSFQDEQGHYFITTCIESHDRNARIFGFVNFCLKSFCKRQFSFQRNNVIMDWYISFKKRITITGSRLVIQQISLKD